MVSSRSPSLYPLLVALWRQSADSLRRALFSSQRCSICHEKGGAPIQCAEKKCCKPFHVSCARDKGLLESMAQEGPTLLPDFERGAMPRVWCEVHRPVSLSFL